MTEWQPIETAPSDEDASILGYDINGTICVICYVHDDNDCEPVWFEAGMQYAFKPTHWMPLPKLPEVKE